MVRLSNRQGIFVIGNSVGIVHFVILYAKKGFLYAKNLILFIVCYN